MNFVTLFAWLDQDELYGWSASFSASGKFVDGCPFLLQLKCFFVSIDEVILQVHFQISMLGAALPQESIGKVALLGVLTFD